jgi:hypothetical protein
MLRYDLHPTDFPDRRQIHRGEGGDVSVAERDGKFFVTIDENALAHLLDDEELGVQELAKVLEFPTAADRQAYLTARGWSTPARAVKRLYVPSSGPSSWQVLLSQPDVHWKRGASAMELAISWELAAKTGRGLPQEVGDVLDRHEATRGAQLLFGVPEHRVELPGGRRASQTDLWAVARADYGLISIAVEGKAGEPFGPTVAEWFQDASPGKHLRFTSLCDELGITAGSDSALRYQLFHRTASAILEGRRIGASTAVLLVQNFRRDTNGWNDFAAFAAGFGGEATRGGICEARPLRKIRLLLAWVDSPLATDEQVANTL